VPQLRVNGSGAKGTASPEVFKLDFYIIISLSITLLFDFKFFSLMHLFLAI